MKKNILKLVLCALLMPLLSLGQKEKKPSLYYPVTKDNKYGFMDATGKVVIQPVFDETYLYNYDAVYENEMFPVKKGNLWGYCNLKGEMVIQPKFVDVKPFKDGLALVTLPKDIAPDYNKNKAFIDLTGTQITKHDVYDHNDFTDMPVVKEGLIGIKEFKTGKWGYLDIKGKVIIPFIYDYVMPFSEGLALVVKGDLSGYIDKTGKEVIKIQYPFANSFKENTAVIQKAGDTITYNFIDKTGKITGSTKMELAGSKISTNDIIFTDGVCRFQKDDRIGLIDKTGKIILEPTYDKIYPFVGEGLWLVCNEIPKRTPLQDRQPRGAKTVKQDATKPPDKPAENRKVGYGYIDKTGKLIIDIKFKEARNFFYGFANFSYEKDKWGVLDLKGNVIVEPTYKNDAHQYTGGLIKVNGPNYFKGEFGYVDKTGKWIWPMPVFEVNK